MTPLDEMINELSPNGVAFERLADIGTWYGGGTPSKSRREYWQDGTIPWVSPKDMGLPVVDSTQDYITEAAIKGSATKLVPPTSVAMVVRSSILDRIFPTALIPVAVALNQDMKAVVPRPDILPEYLAHVLRSQGEDILRAARKTGGSVASIETRNLFDFQIPVPPVGVQREIVRVLDQFRELESELKARLQAELEARRQQYEYYRNYLLTADNDAPWSTLGGVSLNVTSGGTPSSGRSEYYGGEIPWLRTQEVNYTDITSTSMMITDAGLKNSSAKWIPANCVIVAMYGATAAKVAINAIPLTTNQACCNLQIDPSVADYRYVFYWVSNEYERLKSKGEGSQSNLNAKKVKDHPIPVPSLERQREIVRVLDHFTKVVTELSEALPAELHARRKQHEYYRGRILSFEEARA